MNLKHDPIFFRSAVTIENNIIYYLKSDRECTGNRHVQALQLEIITHIATLHWNRTDLAMGCP